MEQRTDEWIKARLGKITASNLYRLTNTSRRRYLEDLAYERMSKKLVKEEVNWYMERGSKLEDVGREELSLRLDSEIQTVGFIEATDPELAGWFGASPDGLIEKDGKRIGVEIKCLWGKSFRDAVQRAKHGYVKKEHYFQIVGGLLATGWDGWIYYLYSDQTEERGLVEIGREGKEQELEMVKKLILNAVEELKELTDWRE